MKKVTITTTRGTTHTGQLLEDQRHNTTLPLPFIEIKVQREKTTRRKVKEIVFLQSGDQAEVWVEKNVITAPNIVERHYTKNIKGVKF